MNHSRFAVALCICIAGAVAACGDAHDAAWEQLKKDGYTIVSLRDDDAGFEFHASKDGQHCYGTIKTGFFGKTKVTCEPYEDACHRKEELANERLLGAGCNEKVLACCVGHGNVLQRDENPESITDFQTACDGGNPWGCNNLGYAYANGKGTAPDPVKGYQAFQKACDSGKLPESCAAAAWNLRTGSGAAMDLPRARTMYKDACDANSQDGCVGLGLMLVLGEGGPEDKTKGTAILVNDCDHDAKQACGLLANLVRKETIADPDKKFATWAQKGCELSDPLACVELGTAQQLGTVGQAKDPVKAVLTLTKGCRAGSGPACLFAAQLASSGAAGAVNQTEVDRAFADACRLGEAEACAHVKPGVAPK